MSTVIDEPQLVVEPTGVRAWAQGRTVYVELHDGRVIGFPADRFRRLSQATDEQLTKVQLDVNGYALALGGAGRRHYHSGYCGRPI